MLYNRGIRKNNAYKLYIVLFIKVQNPILYVRKHINGFFLNEKKKTINWFWFETKNQKNNISKSEMHII